MKLLTRKSLFRIPLWVLLGFSYWGFSQYLDEQNIQKAVQNHNQSKRFSLVELYTSQGCSSCPPADQILQSLAHKNKLLNSNIATLSLHVDYWNFLGWTDPNSKVQFSKRQSFYQNKIPFKRRYTPQVIINGTFECLGTNTSCIKKALNKSQATEINTLVTLSESGNQLILKSDFPVSLSKQIFQIQYSWVYNQKTKYVSKGENKGRTLENHHIAKGIVSLDPQQDIFQISKPSLSQLNDMYLTLWLEDENGKVIGGIQWNTTKLKPTQVTSNR